MELLNIIASKFNASNVELLNKGWSDDTKYILTINNERYLLRLSNISLYDSKKRQYKYLKEIAKLDIYCSKIIDFGTIDNYLYMLFTYLEGKPAEEVLKNETNNLSAYSLGVNAGKYLKQIHSIKIIDYEPSIYDRFNNKLIKNLLLLYFALKHESK